MRKAYQLIARNEKRIQDLVERLETWHKGHIKCSRCHGEGIIEVPDGPDDFTHAFCGCEYGRGLDRDYRMKLPKHDHKHRLKDELFLPDDLYAMEEEAKLKFGKELKHDRPQSHKG